MLSEIYNVKRNKKRSNFLYAVEIKQERREVRGTRRKRKMVGSSYVVSASSFL